MGGFLSWIGKKASVVFSWLGSKQGQSTIAAAEGVAVGVAGAVGAAAPVAAAISLINNWITEAVKVESIAAAAGAQTGSGTAKAAAVVSTMVPELTQYLQAQGLTSQQISDKANTINTAVVALLNTLDAPASPGTNTSSVASATN